MAMLAIVPNLAINCFENIKRNTLPLAATVYGQHFLVSSFIWMIRGDAQASLLYVITVL